MLRYHGWMWSFSDDIYKIGWTQFTVLWSVELSCSGHCNGDGDGDAEGALTRRKFARQSARVSNWWYEFAGAAAAEAVVRHGCSIRWLSGLELLFGADCGSRGQDWWRFLEPDGTGRARRSCERWTGIWGKWSLFRGFFRQRERVLTTAIQVGARRCCGVFEKLVRW